jgi:hypothetical protein
MACPLGCHAGESAPRSLTGARVLAVAVDHPHAPIAHEGDPTRRHPAHAGQPPLGLVGGRVHALTPRRIGRGAGEREVAHREHRPARHVVHGQVQRPLRIDRRLHHGRGAQRPGEREVDRTVGTTGERVAGAPGDDGDAVAVVQVALQDRADRVAERGAHRQHDHARPRPGRVREAHGHAGRGRVLRADARAHEQSGEGRQSEDAQDGARRRAARRGAEVGHQNGRKWTRISG